MGSGQGKIQSMKGHVRRPWTTAEAWVCWPSTDGLTEVRFDQDGVTRWRSGVQLERYAWARIADLEIRVPYSAIWQWRLAVLGNLVSPKPFAHSEDAVLISFVSGFDIVSWELGRSGPYSWRLQFLLDDLLQLLTKDSKTAALGTPGVLDRVTEDVAPQLKRRSRLFLYVDLLGLDRFLGGHGGFDPDLRAALAGATRAGD